MLFVKSHQAPVCESIVLLGTAPLGFRGTIKGIDASTCAKSGLSPGEVERRLMEMGFVEGSVIEIKHEGFWRRDPIAVKVNNTTIALRRRVANAIQVCPSPSGEDE
jgi:ferrous iron transport protein A